jgi:hypothetical protein
VAKAELKPDGYARITEGLQAAREAVIGGLFDAGRARERLREANRALAAGPAGGLPFNARRRGTFRPGRGVKTNHREVANE